jgi:hypothetical protein
MIIVQLILINRWCLQKMKDGFNHGKKALAIRETSNLAYSVATWFAAGGAYHAYYMCDNMVC